MIREFTFYPELTRPYGLEPCGPIRDLGRIVCLVGANGAGKTRYLRLIQDMLASAPRASQEHSAVAEDLRRLEGKLAALASGPARSAPSEQVARLTRHIEEKRLRLAFLARLLEPGAILVDGPNGPAPPAPTDLCIDLTVRPVAHDDEGRDPVRDAQRGAPEVVERAARALFNAENTRLAGTPAVAEAAREAERLNELLAALLNKRIEPEVDTGDGVVHARLGGRRFEVTELSSGEHMLLIWAVLLHRHAAQLRDSVLLLDEPEVHLHPAATARLFSRLFDDQGPGVLGERGQVWLATHSPGVLLAAHAERVLLVEGGALSWSEAASPRVLDDLAVRPPPPSRLAPRPLPIGSSDFQKLRRAGARYVDKTAFAAEVLRDPSEVLLFTRPRRFGKTMNQSALRYFLEKTDEDRSDLFRDLAIWQDHQARRHFQVYPVIALTFKDVKARTWPECRDSLALKVANLFGEHHPAVASALSTQEAARFEAIVERRAGDAELREALGFLTEILARHHGRPVVILIDEYDEPIHSAYRNSYYDEAVGFFRSFLSQGLKDNRHLFKGVLTGILRVAKESLFSDLNNVTSYSLLCPEFADHFGFTEDEVAGLLRETGNLGRQAELKEWYDGYRFGGCTIYNPWSVARYLNQKEREPRPYWINTGSDELVKSLLIDRGVGLSGELSKLLSGGAIHKTVIEELALRDIEQRPDAVWSLLLFSGYLKPSPITETGPERRLALTIPNREVRQAFESLVRTNLVDRLDGEGEVERLMRALLSGDERTVEELIGRFLLTSMSSHSAAGRRPEEYYEGFLLGLGAHLRSSHQVLSQENAGRGRADILIVPRTPGSPGVVLELKTIKKDEAEEKALDAALRQIEDRQYTVKLEAHGASPIHAFAAVFNSQRVQVKKAVTRR